MPSSLLMRWRCLLFLVTFYLSFLFPETEPSLEMGAYRLERWHLSWQDSSLWLPGLRPFPPSSAFRPLSDILMVRTSEAGWPEHIQSSYLYDRSQLLWIPPCLPRQVSVSSLWKVAVWRPWNQGLLSFSSFLSFFLKPLTVSLWLNGFKETSRSNWWPHNTWTVGSIIIIVLTCLNT